MTAREVAGLVALDMMYAAVGYGWLCGLGFVRSGKPALRLSGLAVFLGWALVGVTTSLALVCGIALDVWQVVILAVIVGCAPLLAVPRFAAAQLPAIRSERGTALVCTLGGAAVLVAYLFDLLRAAAVEVTTAWDANGFWVLKAAALVYQRGLHTADGQFASFTNADYPLFAPTQDALTFRFTGHVDVGLLPTQHWLIAVAFLGAVAGLLAGWVRPLILWPGLAIVALMPAFEGLIGSSLGDEPLAMQLAVAAVIASVWLVERDDRLVVLCAVFLAAAAWTKVEGLPGALLVALMLLLAGRFRRWRLLVPLAVFPIVAILPWRVWEHMHHIVSAGANPYSRLLHPEFLWHTRGRFGSALAQLPSYLLDPGSWLLAVPVALVLGVLLLRRRGAVGVFVVGVALVAYVGNAAVYWISPNPLKWYIDTSAPRVVSSNALICGVLAPLLLALLYREQDAALPGSRTEKAAGQGLEP